MPIRAEYRWLYPLDWPQLSAVIRFERAKGRCENFGRPHGQIVRHLGDGRWKALCQRCHLLHDRAEHQRRRWQTLHKRKALGDLFLGPYRR